MSKSSTRFTLRWAVDTSLWEPHTEEWQFLLNLLPSQEAEAVQRFKFQDDRKRALISRLLQRTCVRTALGLPDKSVHIQRTKGRKPFFAGPKPVPDCPNFNFNVSHEGSYVVLVSEPICLCGVDVAAPQQLRRKALEPLDTFFSRFLRQFTASEWEAIRNAGSDDDSKEAAFRQHWSLKEALVKARGDGIAFDMGRACFQIDGQHLMARLWLDGVEQPRWRFYLQELRQGHWVSIARAPIEAVVDAWGVFRSSLERKEFTEAEWQDVLEEPSPHFSLLSILDLVPEDRRNEYAAAGGEML